MFFLFLEKKLETLKNLPLDIDSSHPITLLNMNPGNALIDKYSVLFTLIKDNNEPKYKKFIY